MIARRVSCTRAALVLGLALALAGCRPPTPIPPSVPLDVPSLLSGLAATAEARRSLRARTRISIEAPDLEFDRPQRLAVERPGSMRVEILGLFSQIAAVLVVRDGRYQLWESGARDFEEGPVTSGLLWRVARVALDPQDAIALLLGAPAPLAWLEPGPARWDGLLFDVDFLDEQRELRERLSFDQAGRLRRFERFNPIGELVWSAAFDDHRDLEGGDGAMHAFAHEVKLYFPREGAEVEIEFDDVELDGDLAPALFELRRAHARADSHGVVAR